MLAARWRVLSATVAVSALVALAGGPAAAAPKAKSCGLLKPAEIQSAFRTVTNKGKQQGSDCTWQVGDAALSLELTTKNAKSTYTALRDVAAEAGSTPEKIDGVGNEAVYVEIPSFKELLVLKGKKFLFLRLLDIVSPVDTQTAKTALTDLGKKAAKRA